MLFDLLCVLSTKLLFLNHVFHLQNLYHHFSHGLVFSLFVPATTFASLFLGLQPYVYTLILFSNMHGMFHSILPFSSSTPCFLWLVTTFWHWLYFLSPSICSKLVYVVYNLHICVTPTSYVVTIPTFHPPIWLIWFLMSYFQTQIIHPNSQLSLLETFLQFCYCPTPPLQAPLQIWA